MNAETETLHPSLANKADFSDKINPMIVKELRQGLRTRTFISLFVGLQVLLSLVIFISAGASFYGDAGGKISGVILFFFTLAALLFQPLRGTSAVANEIKQDTIDLMALTKLNSWKIVFGKWLSLVSQTALLFVTVVPYLVLRYFFGGMELIAELMYLVTLFIFSMALTAITVGLSANKMPLIRLILPIIGIPMFLMMTVQMITFSSMGGRSSSFTEVFDFTDPDFVWGYLGVISFTIYLGYYFLEMGATAIAPMAENRATRKRIIGLIALVITLTVFTIFVDEDVAAVLGSIICFLISLDVLTERKEFTQSVTQPFLKKGALRILAKTSSRLLYPGWPTGLLFYGLCSFLVVGVLSFTNAGRDDDILGFCLVTLYSALVPCLLARLFESKIKNLLSFHIIIWICSVIILSLVGMAGGILGQDEIFHLLIPLPFGGYLTIDSLDIESIWGIYLCLYFIMWLACFVKALPVFARYRQLEASAKAALENDD